MSKNESLVCNLEGDPRNITRALDECERFAREEQLSEKEVLHLRLLAEELMGMAVNLLKVQDGTFQVFHEKDGYELHLKVNTKTNETSRAQFLSVASDQRNAAYVGVTGKIRQAIDYTFADASIPPLVGIDMDSPFDTSMNYEWSYQRYCEEMAKQGAQEWDELEKSVLTKLTRDIIVGVRPEQVSVVIKAK